MTVERVASRIETPIGAVWAVADGDTLRELHLPNGPPPTAPLSAEHPVLTLAADELGRWFAGELRSFTVRAEAASGTPFQRRVWAALRTIPYGARWSYGQLAAAIGEPAAARAVGAANGRNPLPIVVPCHRVIGASGALVGFGGGLPAKAALLEIERRAASPALPFA